MMDGRVFFFGGMSEDRTVLASAEEYIASERRWAYLPDMPRAAYDTTAVAWNGKLLVIGGRSEDAAVSRAVSEYDPVRRSWRELPPMIGGRAGCAAVVVGPGVMVMGGSGGSGWRAFLRTVELYDSRSGCWEARRRMTKSFSEGRVAVVHRG